MIATASTGTEQFGTPRCRVMAAQAGEETGARRRLLAGMRREDGARMATPSVAPTMRAVLRTPEAVPERFRRHGRDRDAIDRRGVEAKADADDEQRDLDGKPLSAPMRER